MNCPVQWHINRVNHNLKYYKQIFFDEVISHPENLTKERLTALENVVERYKNELKILQAKNPEYFV